VLLFDSDSACLHHQIAALVGKRKHGFALERAVFLTVLHRLFASGSDRAAPIAGGSIMPSPASTGSICISSSARRRGPPPL
jgi:hypothetical protein